MRVGFGKEGDPGGIRVRFCDGSVVGVRVGAFVGINDVGAALAISEGLNDVVTTDLSGEGDLVSA